MTRKLKNTKRIEASVQLTPSTHAIVKSMSEEENRSLSNMIEVLIIKGLRPKKKLS